MNTCFSQHCHNNIFFDTLVKIFNKCIKENIIMAALRKTSIHSVNICRLMKNHSNKIPSFFFLKAFLPLLFFSSISISSLHFHAPYCNGGEVVTQN